MPATPKKLADARKKGNVARSQELNMAFGLLFAIMGLKAISPHLVKTISKFMLHIFGKLHNADLTTLEINTVFREFWLSFFIIFLPFCVLMVVLNMVVSYVQVGSMWTFETMRPSLDKFNPISGFKRLFSMEKIVDLLKSVLKLVIIGVIAKKFFQENIPIILTMKISTAESYMADLGGLVYKLGMKAVWVLLILAFADFAYRKYKYKKDLMMSHEEVKEESKQSQGNPHIKGQIKKKRMEMRKRLSLKEVPKATVVVTNPEHIAIAIKYDPSMDAPLLTAKGADHLAQKIKEIARKHSVPIVENKPLARNLYKNVDLNQQYRRNFMWQ